MALLLISFFQSFGLLFRSVVSSVKPVSIEARRTWRSFEIGVLVVGDDRVRSDEVGVDGVIDGVIPTQLRRMQCTVDRLLQFLVPSALALLAVCLTGLQLQVMISAHAARKALKQSTALRSNHVSQRAA